MLKFHGGLGNLKIFDNVKISVEKDVLLKPKNRSLVR